MTYPSNPSRTLILVEIAPPVIPADPYQVITPVTDVAGMTPYSPAAAFWVGQQVYIPCQAVNGVGPFTWSATGLAGTGLSIDVNTGEITGTLTTQGFFSATITATDTGNGGATAQQVIGLDVGGAFKLIGDLQPFTNNQAYQAGLFAGPGFTGTLTWSMTGAPNGVTISSTTGLLTGTPHDTNPLNYTVKITATDSGTGTSASKTFVLMNARAPGSVAVKVNNTGTGTTAPTAQAGSFFSATCSLINSLLGGQPAGTAPVVWDDGGTLPSFLSLDAGTGIISGNIPANGSVGTYSVTITGTDINGATASRTFNLNVVAGINLIAAAFKFVVGSVSDPQGVTTLDFFAMFFGNGQDGAFVLDGTNSYPNYFTKVGFVYTMLKPIYASSFQIATGVTLQTNGLPLFVQGVLSFVGNSMKIITRANSAFFGVGTSGGPGGTCTTTVGNPGGAGTPAGTNQGTIGVAGQGGQGGSGTSGSGGAPGAPTTSPAQIGQTSFPVRSPFLPLAYGNAWFMGGCAGGGGGGGGGNGTASLGVGGPGGDGGGVIQIYAYTIDTTGVSGTSPFITASGLDGTAGTNSAISGRGGGGGGGAGSGGIVWIVCVNRLGTAIADFLRVDGGTGGNPGTQPTLTNPTAGKGGGSGYAVMFVLGNATAFESLIGAPSGGQSATLGRVNC